MKNRDNLVAALRLAARPRAALGREITSDDFDVPTTIARFGKRLYLPNARFTSPDATDFSVVQVRR